MAPQPKRRKLNESRTEEVVFDPKERFEYLTGFHKRKVERTKHAQEAALRRAREEKIQERKKLREERKVELERHLQEVNAMIPARTVAKEEENQNAEGEQDDWNGLTDPDPIPVDHEEEYIDEDKYTTVMVEEVDVSRNGLTRLRNSAEDEDENGDEETAVSLTDTKGKPPKSSAESKTRKAGTARGNEKPSISKKRRKRDFRYESKADRKLNHLKVRAKKSKLAQARRDR